MWLHSFREKMRLTLALLFDKLPNGNIFRGKHKLEPKIRNWMKRELIDDIQREERNMLVLRNHYLTKEQVNGYRFELGKHEDFRMKVLSIKRRNFPDHVRLEDRYGVLRQMDSWEKF